MNVLLRKPLHSSSSLSSGILRMRKVVEINGVAIEPAGTPYDLAKRPGWLLPIANQTNQDYAIMKAGGTPYDHLRRQRSNTDPAAPSSEAEA